MTHHYSVPTYGGFYVWLSKPWPPYTTHSYARAYAKELGVASGREGGFGEGESLKMPAAAADSGGTAGGSAGTDRVMSTREMELEMELEAQVAALTVQLGNAQAGSSNADAALSVEVQPCHQPPPTGRDAGAGTGADELQTTE